MRLRSELVIIPPELVSETKDPMIPDGQEWRHTMLVPDLVGPSQIPSVLVLEALQDPKWVGSWTFLPLLASGSVGYVRGGPPPQA